ncbi:MAG: ABC transporter permease [Sphaerochaetaceae bacterium]|jgi:ribose/xylose/arabinose/galactoside ABC-type transport system permease subunit|nr:ABC transporter permease [Sphaerochaetaceae bacterium]
MLEKQRNAFMYLPVYVAAIAIYLLAGILQPRFLTWNNNVNLFTRIVPLLFAGIAQTFVLLTGGIDLSVGSIIGLTNVIAASLPFPDTGMNLLLWATVPLLVGAAIGLSNGVIISRWGFPPFIVTFATSTIWTGVALFIMDVPGGEISISIYRTITGKLFGVIPVPLLIIIGFVAFAHMILRHTVFGRSIYAIGGNKQVAKESGINVSRIEMFSYMSSGMFAALGGMYLSAIMISGDPLVGDPYVMNSIAIAVIGGVALIGGRGGVQGLIGAAYIFYLIDNLLNLLGVSTFYQYVAKGLVIILALTLTSREQGFSMKRGLLSVGRKAKANLQ